MIVWLQIFNFENVAKKRVLNIIKKGHSIFEYFVYFFTSCAYKCMKIPSSSPVNFVSSQYPKDTSEYIQ